MEKHFPQGLVSLIDKQRHNQNQCLYERFEAKPLRNSLQFNFDSLDINICSVQIIEKINFLRELFESSQSFEQINFEIRVTDFTWYLKISNFNPIMELIEILLKDNTLSYFESNSQIIKSESMIDYIGKQIIKYNPKSFRQSDDNIKNKIYEILTQEIKSQNLYLIGGEMVFFAKLLNPLNFMAITDFESIYKDANCSFPENYENIKLINYDSHKLPSIESIHSMNNYNLIANTSKHGLGQNLSKEILRLEFNNIAIISCNKKSFLRDFLMLKSKYICTKIYDITTNYEVTIYFLQINFDI